MVRVPLDEPFETLIVSPVANATPTLVTDTPVTGPVPVRTRFQPGVTPRPLTPASVWSTPKTPNTWLLTNELDVVLLNSALQNAFVSPTQPCPKGALFALSNLPHSAILISLLILIIYIRERFILDSVDRYILNSYVSSHTWLQILYYSAIIII